MRWRDKWPGTFQLGQERTLRRRRAARGSLLFLALRPQPLRNRPMLFSGC